MAYTPRKVQVSCLTRPWLGKVCVIILLFAAQQGLAQQNFFNVPSSDITYRHSVFFQQQVNINADVLQSNTNLCYGLGREFEIGINVLALNFNPAFKKPLLLTNNDNGAPPISPCYTINAQKAWVLNKILKVAAGTQTGLGAGSHFVNYTYLNLVSIFTKTHTKVVTGLYYVNENMLGEGDRNPFSSNIPLGLQTGVEQTIVAEKLFLILENISGKHSMGETTVGGSYFLSSNWVVSCGYQFANPNGQAANATVVEITYVPAAHLQQRLHHHGHTRSLSEHT